MRRAGLHGLPGPAPSAFSCRTPATATEVRDRSRRLRGAAPGEGRSTSAARTRPSDHGVAKDLAQRQSRRLAVRSARAAAGPAPRLANQWRVEAALRGRLPSPKDFAQSFRSAPVAHRFGRRPRHRRSLPAGKQDKTPSRLGEPPAPSEQAVADPNLSDAALDRPGPPRLGWCSRGDAVMRHPKCWLANRGGAERLAFRAGGVGFDGSRSPAAREATMPGSSPAAARRASQTAALAARPPAPSDLPRFPGRYSVGDRLDHALPGRREQVAERWPMFLPEPGRRSAVRGILRGQRRVNSQAAPPCGGASAEPGSAPASLGLGTV